MRARPVRLSPDELVRLRRMVGLPDALPADIRPRCACGCGQHVAVGNGHTAIWSRWARGHNPRPKARRRAYTSRRTRP